MDRPSGVGENSLQLIQRRCIIALIMTRLDGSELTYSVSREFAEPGGEPDALPQEGAALKRRVDAMFDFCIFFVSPAAALVFVLSKQHTPPFSLAFITQMIAVWLTSLVLPFMAGFFAGANRQYINKRVFLIVWAHLTAALLYGALSGKL